MKAFILAGGFGTRLREVIHGRPKALAVVQGRPFLEHIIRYLRTQGIVEIVLGVGYLANYVRDTFGDGQALGVKIQYSEEDRPLGTAGAIKNAAKFFAHDFLVLNGDTYVDVDLKELNFFHSDRKADVTIVTTTKYHGRGGLIQTNKKGRVTSFEEHSQKKNRGYNNTGFYLFSPKILKLMRSNERSFLEKDLFPLLLKKKHRVFAFDAGCDFIDIGSPQRYKEAKQLLKV
ncbi:MAG: nucleotidyltransferase family protein [Pseudomonadota bacterium]